MNRSAYNYSQSDSGSKIDYDILKWSIDIIDILPYRCIFKSASNGRCSNKTYLINQKIYPQDSFIPQASIFRSRSGISYREKQDIINATLSIQS